MCVGGELGVCVWGGCFHVGFIHVTPFLMHQMLLGLMCIFGGCCLNIVSLEILLNLDKGIGKLVTLSQFALIAFIGLRK